MLTVSPNAHSVTDMRMIICRHAIDSIMMFYDVLWCIMMYYIVL